jgi:uncharacterized repeat protein (TIGR01451 family)
MKRFKLLALLLVWYFAAEAQVQKIEVYQIGTKIALYPGACDTGVPEAAGKITFCDRAGNLGVVEASYGLNARGIRKMAANHFNNDEVFITQAGISIRKADGSWDNIPSYSVPATFSPANMTEAMVTPSGKLLTRHGNATGLHLLDLNTRKFSTLRYRNGSGTVMNVFTELMTYDPVTQKTYIIAQLGANYLFSYDGSDSEDGLEYLGLLNTVNLGLATNKKFVVSNGFIWLGTSNGLYKIRVNDLEQLQLFNATNILPFNRVDDMDFDGEGNLWMAITGINDGTICRLDTATMSLTLNYQQPTANPNISVRFNSLALSEGKVWAVANNFSGFQRLDFSGETPVVEAFNMTAIRDLGFPMTYSPDHVFRYRDRVYLFTLDFSSSVNANFEALIHQNGRWSGITDDEPGSISFWQSRRFNAAYPTENGTWWYNQFDEGVAAYFGNDGARSRIYRLGGGNGMVVDADNSPVIPQTRNLRKVDPPLNYTLPAPGTNVNLTAVKRYKDQLWALERVNRTIHFYKENRLAGALPLDQEAYGSALNFGVDTQGNAWFGFDANPDFLVKRFNANSLSTTDFNPGLGRIGFLEDILAMPNGQVAFIGRSAILLYDGQGNFKRLDNTNFAALSNLRGASVDTTGRLHAFRHDAAQVITITQPFSDTPQFRAVVLEGTTGNAPSIGFYRPGAMLMDAEGHFWGHGSGNWMKVRLDDAVPSFLNAGKTYGVAGRVFADLNENGAFDEGEGFANQPVTLFVDGRQINSFTDSQGRYYFSYVGENTEYWVTLPTLSGFFVATQLQQTVSVTNLQQDTQVPDFVLRARFVNSIMVKSSARPGMWGFIRPGFENTFTTGIANLSFTKTFNNLEVDYIFKKDDNRPDMELPEVEGVKVYRLQPEGLTHLISYLNINPLTHRWYINLIRTAYTQTELDISYEEEVFEEGKRIRLTLPELSPLDLYIVEIATGLFPAEFTGSVVTYGVSRVGSPDLGGGGSGGTGGSVALLPFDPGGSGGSLGGLGDLGPYLSPDQVYDEPPYLDPADVYGQPPFDSRIFSSYDPNDKLVSPGLPDTLNLTDIDQKWLTYTVRFQNDGNFSAKDVFIIDAIDPMLDLSTFTLLEASHPLRISQLDLIDSVALRFSFDDIYLDYSDNNLEASQGHVKFMIKARDDIALNTIVENGAAIYFDQNPPIITNRVRNKFVERYNLRLGVSPSEAGELNSLAAGSFLEGQQVRLNAQSLAGFQFLHWTANGQVVSTALSFTYTMPGTDVVLVANFQVPPPPSFTLTLNVQPAEGGTVTLRVNGQVQTAPFTFEEGTSVSLTATPNSGFQFASWGLGTGQSTQNPLVFELTRNTLVLAVFDVVSSLANDPDAALLELYPNPARETLHLSAPFPIEQVALYDAKGREIGRYPVGATQHQFSLSHLESGLYLLQIQGKGKVFSKKVLLVR